MKSLYVTLGVSENASKDEIKKAYRNLAKQYHPDTNSSNKELEEKFKEVNSAYEILGDDNKKAQYDRYGDSMFNQGNQGNHPHSGMGFEDILSSMFGGGFGRQQPNLDKHVRIGVSIEDIIKGSEIKVQGLRVKIPTGISNDSRIKVQGKGNTHNGKTGDLVIHIIAQSDAKFEVHGNDLHTSLVLNINEAIFGCSKEIDLYGDKVNIKVPKDSKYGQKLRIQKGFGGGHLFAHLDIKLPQSSNTPQEDVLKLIK